MVQSLHTPPYPRPHPNLTPEQKFLIAKLTLEFKEEIRKNVGRYSESIHALVLKSLALY